MSRNFTPIGQDHLYQITNIPVPNFGAAGCAVSFWVRPTNIGTGSIKDVFNFSDSSDNQRRHFFFTNKMFISHKGYDNPTPVNLDVGEVTAGTWYHVYGYFGSNVDFKGRMNGGTVQAYAGYTGQFNNYTRLLCGTRFEEFNGSDCDIAEIGIWDVELTEDEQQRLAAGMPPSKVNLDNLQAYYPLWGGSDVSEPNSVPNGNYPNSHFLFTDVNNTPKADHPNVIHTYPYNPFTFASALVSQEIDVTGIASGEAVGSPTINQEIICPGIASEEALGSPNLSLHIVSTGIASEEALGTPTISGESELVPEGIPTGEAMGAPEISRGNITLNITSISSEEALGVPTLTTSTLFITVDGIPSEEATGNNITLDLQMSVEGIPSTESFGTPEVTAENVSIQVPGILSGETLGAPQIVVNGVTIAVTGITSEEALGQQTLLPGNIPVAPTGIESEEAFGAAIIITGNVSCIPEGIPSEEALGNLTINTGLVLIAPAGIPSEEAFSNPTVIPSDITISIPSINSQEALGVITLNIGEVLISPEGVQSEEALGALTVGVGSIQVIVPGIPSEEAFTSPTIHLNIAVPGIPSEEALGNANFTVAGVFVSPVGIASEEALGTAAVLNVLILDLNGFGIASEEALGSPEVYLFVKNNFQTDLTQDLEDSFYDTDEFADSLPAMIYFHKAGLYQEFIFIYNHEFEEIEGAGRSSVLSRSPVLRCQDRFIREPSYKDKIVVRNQNYKIISYEPNGYGDGFMRIQKGHTNEIY